jgi:hypothetical protein
MKCRDTDVVSAIRHKAEDASTAAVEIMAVARRGEQHRCRKRHWANQRRWRTALSDSETRSEPPESHGNDENTHQTGGLHQLWLLCHLSTRFWNVDPGAVGGESPHMRILPWSPQRHPRMPQMVHSSTRICLPNGGVLKVWSEGFLRRGRIRM